MMDPGLSLYCFFAVGTVLLFTMDLSEEQDSLVAIGSEFSTSLKILTEEAHSLIACSPDNCSNVHVTKQEGGILPCFVFR